MFGQLVFGLGALIFGDWMIRYYKNYLPPDKLYPKHDSSESNPYYENTAIFYATNICNIVSALAFSVGKPFRAPLHENKLYLLYCLFLGAFNFYLVFDYWIMQAMPWLEGFNEEVKNMVKVTYFSSFYCWFYSCFKGDEQDIFNLFYLKLLEANSNGVDQGSERTVLVSACSLLCHSGTVHFLLGKTFHPSDDSDEEQ